MPLRSSASSSVPNTAHGSELAALSFRSGQAPVAIPSLVYTPAHTKGPQPTTNQVRHPSHYQNINEIPIYAMISGSIANGTPYVHQPTTVLIESNPADQSRTKLIPGPWSLTATRPLHQETTHNTIQVNTGAPQNRRNDDMRGLYCNICKMFCHHTTNCVYQQTILDPSPENLQKLDISEADTIIAMTYVRNGSLTYDEITAIRSRDDWRATACQLYLKLPTRTADNCFISIKPHVV
jgi:hypothetical protein